ncbi:type I restriction-modification system [Geminocystis sp. NIES-3708]|uniref:type I restriction-modification enzyme R subunit C-terminal domain-containing protein n=1 Tax=Geminocystis sp. NIES-3708 TaxID=1615909 RepID=UPI0005FC76B1|nr:type I restriction-modification enzyme R subunit C-terminal domain-containing protein [Geminocystis sp. NIES-3708]BAQ60381.1 type I restriction-modification system [Geminocystis sp. NIES-3708]
MFLTTKTTSQITGCTLRQLQYWREQGLVVPEVDATGKGRSVFYTRENLVVLMVMQKLLSGGLDYSQACAGLEALKERDPHFTDSNIQSRYLLSHDDDHTMVIMDFEINNIEQCLKKGCAVIPIWLDEIHSSLTEKLDQVSSQEIDHQEIRQKAQQMESEATTRKNRIDQILSALGWNIVDYTPDLDSSQLVNHGVREYPLTTGRADYVLFVNGLLVGIIEAKKILIEPLSALEQAKRYSKGAFEGIGNWEGYRVPFLYSSNGQLIYFLDVREKFNLAREISSFHTPNGLAELLKRKVSFSFEWLENNPIEQNEHLRPYQVEAIASIEKAIAEGRRELLVAMATGTGKTFMIVSSIYRLLVSKRVKRVLFLVDRRALAAQAVRAFASFSTPNGKKFDQEYEVYSQQFQQEDFGEEDKFNSKVLPNKYLTDPSEVHTFVYVSTIQRMKLNLFGNANNHVILNDSEESERFLDKFKKTEKSENVIVTDDSGDCEFEDGVEQLPIPIHAFDLIISDECHRGYTASENGYWRRVLDHFDAIKIGLTATPAIHTLNLFKEVVFRYSTEQAIADGYLVDYEQVNINSEVTINGAFLREGEMVTRVDQETGENFYDQLEDEREFNATDIERKITVPDRTRKIIQEIAKYAEQHEQETGRFPKILIFACNDLEHTSHANQVVSICKEVFNRGDDFVQKITGKVDRPLQKIREFRNRPKPAIAVTVDLLTTGIDIPAIEFVVFMRFVKSRILWVQMLGRGTRLCKDIDKTHFKVFDCFNGSLVEYFADTTDFRFVPPRQQAMPLSQLVGNIIYDVDRERHLDMLNRRLHRVDRSIATEAREQLDLYLNGASNKGLARTFQDLFDEQPEEALSLLQDQEFIDFLEDYPRRRATFLIAEEVEDTVTSEVVVQGQKPEDYLTAFYRFVEENSEQIEALQILRQRPQDWGVEALEELRSKLKEHRFTEDNLQRAYKLVHQKALADIISLIRSAFDHSYPVYTAEERVERAIASVTDGKQFTDEQLEWLGYIKQHLIQNLSIDLDDFEYAPIFELHGGKIKAQQVFFQDLQDLVKILNHQIAL